MSEFKDRVFTLFTLTHPLCALTPPSAADRSQAGKRWVPVDRFQHNNKIERATRETRDVQTK